VVGQLAVSTKKTSMLKLCWLRWEDEQQTIDKMLFSYPFPSTKGAEHLRKKEGLANFWQRSNYSRR